MTMILPSSLKQPNKKDYLDALSNEYEWPFWLRATIINRYRKSMGRNKPECASPVQGTRATPSHKLKPRYQEKPRKQNSMKKNTVSVTGFKAIVKHNSTGRKRPTHKLKIILRKTKYVLWLKGNKYNGGQHINL